MDEEKDVQRRKKEAAGWAKQLARERLAAKQAAGQTEQPLEETKTQSKDDLALAKKKQQKQQRPRRQNCGNKKKEQPVIKLARPKTDWRSQRKRRRKKRKRRRWKSEKRRKRKAETKKLPKKI